MIEQKNRIRGVNSGVFSKFGSNHTYISDSIILYMPPEEWNLTNLLVMRRLIQVLQDVAQGIVGNKWYRFWDKLQAAAKGSTAVIQELTKEAGFGVYNRLIPVLAQDLYNKFRGRAKNLI